MAKKAATYWINGVVKINGSDVATISSVESSVTLTVNQEQKAFSGSRITAIETHTTKVEGRLKITGAVLNKDMLSKVLGLDKATGTLDDGVTASTNYKTTLKEFFQRPELEILIEGKDDTTGLALEIYAPKAVLMSDLEILLSKEDFAQPELEFMALGDDDNLDTEVFEVRFEDAPTP